MSNNSNSNELPGIKNFPIYITYSITGIIIGASSMVVTVAIARYEALRRNKVYFLIMAQSFADSVNMFTFTIAGIRRSMLIFAGQHNILYTAYQCARVPHVVIWSFGGVLTASMLTVVSIDRLLCVCFPLDYIGWSHKYIMAIIGSAYLYSIASGTIGLTWAYITKDDQVPTIQANCLTHDVMGLVHKVYYIHYNGAPMFWALMSVLIYLVVWIRYKRQNSQMSAENQAQQHQVEHQRKFTKSLGISCLCTFWLWVVPWLVANTANKFGLKLLTMAMFIISMLNPFANVFIYLKRHEEIRQAFKGLFTCKQMPADLQTWKANQQAAAQARAIAAAANPPAVQHDNHVNVEEL